MNDKSIEAGIVSLIKKAETGLPSDVVNALKYALNVEEDIAKTQIKTMAEKVEEKRNADPIKVFGMILPSFPF